MCNASYVSLSIRKDCLCPLPKRKRIVSDIQSFFLSFGNCGVSVKSTRREKIAQCRTENKDRASVGPRIKTGQPLFILK